MREIKFRAWYQPDKVMGLVTTLSLGHAVAISVDGEDYQTGRIERGFINSGEAQYAADWYRFKLMQYTGLKDMHGIEIYESDILHWVEGIGEVPEVLGVVEATTARYVGYQIHWLTPGTVGEVGESHYQYQMVTLSEMHRRELEVIGNVYENPELINKEMI